MDLVGIILTGFWICFAYLSYAAGDAGVFDRDDSLMLTLVGIGGAVICAVAMLGGV